MIDIKKLAADLHRRIYAKPKKTVDRLYALNGVATRAPAPTRNSSERPQ